MDLSDFFVATDTADYLSARKLLPQKSCFPLDVVPSRSWALCADETAGSSSLAFNFACTRVLKCGGDCVAIYISSRASQSPSQPIPSLLCYGRVPTVEVLQRVLIKRVATSDQLIEVLSGIHMLPAPPCAIILDGVDCIPLIRAKTVHLALGLLENATEWAAKKIPSCVALATFKAKPHVPLPPAIPVISVKLLTASQGSQALPPSSSPKRFLLTVSGGDCGLEYEVNNTTKSFSFCKELSGSTQQLTT